LKPANTNVPAEKLMEVRRKRMLDRLREQNWRFLSIPVGLLLVLSGLAIFLLLAASFLPSLQRTSMFTKVKIWRDDD
jgi:multidrug efflux pump subunit AcrB